MAALRISSAPRWLFCRLAILVTLALWLPDAYIWYLGQPADAVAVLVTRFPAAPAGCAAG